MIQESSSKNSKSIGTFLKDVRVRRNMTQADLAKKLGYTTSQFVSNWERGLCSPPLNSIPEIATILGISQKEIREMMNLILEQTRQELEKRLFKKKSMRRNA
jgi:transcriptional regulator with XRE-family HTH domain